MRRRDPKPTWTRCVVDTMVQMDDFLSVHDLMHLTGGTVNQITASLAHLKNCRVVDVISSVEGTLWFLTGDDVRTHTVDMRTPEEPGTRRRRRKTPQPPKIA